jgi:hypothetical protein
MVRPHRIHFRFLILDSRLNGNSTRRASTAAKKLFQNRRLRGGQSCPPRIRTRILAAGKTARRATQRRWAFLKQLLNGLRAFQI